MGCCAQCELYDWGNMLQSRSLRCHTYLSHIPAFQPQSDWQQSCLAVHTHWADFTYPNPEAWHKDLWVDSYTVISALFPWQIQHHFSFSCMYIIPKILLIIFTESAFLVTLKHYHFKCLTEVTFTVPQHLAIRNNGAMNWDSRSHCGENYAVLELRKLTGQLIMV